MVLKQYYYSYCYFLSNYKLINSIILNTDYSIFESYAITVWLHIFFLNVMVQFLWSYTN